MGSERERIILATAERLFAEHGFHAVGMAALGASAGTTGSAIYRHFASKDEILGALFDEASAELIERLGPWREDPREELEALVDAHLDFTLDRRSLALIWLYEQRSLSSAHRRAFLRRRERYLKRWIDALERIHPGVPRAALVAAMNAAQSGLMSVALLPEPADLCVVRITVRSQVLAGIEALHLHLSPIESVLSGDNQ
ncbi:TetR/AcrR family transcriptional regulator [Rhodococcus rhodochrous]|uniref:TetR/AcrR family transcriptional regulator n=1 Tax=Rhodococcus rhodochrous TaxID=1829 RepID=UPI001E496D36|nr:TetR/AcrR family transcriptional regulator [Rhodococcus rhodochrous]MCB8914001.1 TetR/AcrR family transcriptional regulator [Rhodococcus rhodochrous]